MTWTAFIVTIVVIALGIYDLITVVFFGIETSISRFLQATAFASPMVSFSFGCIAGHLFMYMKPKCNCKK